LALSTLYDSAALEDAIDKKKPAASDRVCIRITKETKKQEKKQEKSSSEFTKYLASLQN